MSETGLTAARADPSTEPDAWLRQLSGPVDGSGPAVVVAMIDGEAGKAIADYALQVGADLIVVATHREGQAREMFIGSTALRILRAASCPVLLVRGLNAAAAYHRALLAVDLEPSGERSVRATRNLLAAAQIDLAHAYRLPQEDQLRLHGQAQTDLGTLRALLRAEVEKGLQPYRAAFPAATLHLEHGFAAAVILDLVFRQRPDILVLGKHRGSSAHEHVFGSVTLFLLYTCPTDLLLVP